MLSIPGQQGRLCDGVTRREFIRVGGAAMLGLSLPQIFSLQARANTAVAPSLPQSGWGQAKSVILLFLQGGPSHIDIWDPKPDAPSNVRGEFRPIKTNVPRDMALRNNAETRKTDGQSHAHPLCELHTRWALQPHRRNVSDGYWRDTGQGQAFWTT